MLLEQSLSNVPIKETYNAPHRADNVARTRERYKEQGI